jgi:hypothetical protein
VWVLVVVVVEVVVVKVVLLRKKAKNEPTDQIAPDETLKQENSKLYYIIFLLYE